MPFSLSSRYDDIAELQHGDLKTLVDFNVEVAFIEYDIDQDGFLNFDEWRRYASEDADVKEFLSSWKTATAVPKCPWSGLDDENIVMSIGGGEGDKSSSFGVLEDRNA